MPLLSFVHCTTDNALSAFLFPYLLIFFVSLLEHLFQNNTLTHLLFVLSFFLLYASSPLLLHFLSNHTTLLTVRPLFHTTHTLPLLSVTNTARCLPPLSPLFPPLSPCMSGSTMGRHHRPHATTDSTLIYQRRIVDAPILPFLYEKSRYIHSLITH
jgi:hypothetical protein